MIAAPHRSAVAIGIDIGTSGVRAVAVDGSSFPLTSASAAFTSAEETRSPAVWWRCTESCLSELGRRCSLRAVEGVAVDGTSGTLVAIDADNGPLGDASLYNDTCDDDAIIAAIASAAPAASPARGVTTPVGRAVLLSRRWAAHRIVHQADWIAMRLGSGEAVSDENNALKTGYDLEAESWPGWIDAVGLNRGLLPKVVRAGTVIGPIGEAGLRLGLPATAKIHAGTTDGCASFLATGAHQIGDAVTALGSTLVLKIASDRPIDAPEYGIYSHRVGDIWLVGGASNTGGAVIRALVGDDRLEELTQRLDPARPTGLGYYPLLKAGERFPINDPALLPLLSPRPIDDVVFFQAVLEGIAEIERLGYQTLARLGAPPLRSLRSVGGGAKNRAWRTIRQRALNIAFEEPLSEDAATGAASLVLRQGYRP
ncbi:FGGY-family carbohydrate kinase [Rhizobium rhizogenes]|uniref:FGGY-family carbohydrate kinase n=1 Tax=Rhizobium rhizogenes TaxID=359 RepID=UPI00157412CA|nr:FGGY-family carbohydrate kinase [Rhizobium rhizogenes]NTI26462.1 FGGY-family carbohydrate kinase [Rhizobium rhizogenes]NTI65844.1 FGGY-family carbohydrate kinase [Rhizobium rhizogenes]QTG08751.1 FGGY-family carbohydrate kinase [Rhizobium rhizogenes]